MIKHQEKILTAILIIALAAYAGRSYIRNWFPTKMKFAADSFTNIDNNQPLSIAALKGKVLIVSCYQSWCIDCARETPVLNELSTAIHSDKLVIVYVSDEDASLANAFRQRFAADKIIFTKSAKSLADLNISIFPTTFLLNKKGEVVKTKSGGYDWLGEKKTIEELIAE